MHLARQRSLFLVAVAAAFVTVACGDGSPLSSPTSPTAMPGSTALSLDDPDLSASASTVDEFSALGGGKGREGSSSGGGSGSGKDNDKETPEKDKGDHGRGGEGSSDVDVDDEDDEDDDGDRNGRRRSVSGFVTAIGLDSITVRGVVVKVTPTTIIRHGHRHLGLADIEVGDHAQAKGTFSADRTTLTATEVKVEDTGRDNDDDADEDADEDAEVEGTVSGVTGTCPDVTFLVGTTHVKATVATTFTGLACSGLSGASVEVKGTKQTDGSIAAATVTLD